MKTNAFRSCLAGLMAATIWVAHPLPAAAQSVSGFIYDNSVWTEPIPGPPGDMDHTGQLCVAVFSAPPPVAPIMPVAILATGRLADLAASPAPYTFTFAMGAGVSNGVSLTARAWIDGNKDGVHNNGEPFGDAGFAFSTNAPVTGLAITVTDDSDGNGLPDWWEYHWLRLVPDPDNKPDADPDNDGLNNKTEVGIAQTVPGLMGLSPTDWDTDGDGMDDKWEYKHYGAVMPPGTSYAGMNPCVANATADYDGDGLSDWQEYCGVDGIPRMQLDRIAGSVRVGRLNATGDDLNPLDVDTDCDLLIDSFEAAWYDPANGIDPANGGKSTITNVDTSIAQADPDQDGLTNYREQCLMTNLCQSSANSNIWDWSGRVPFPSEYFHNGMGAMVRVCTMTNGGHALILGLTPQDVLCTSGNRARLRAPALQWTDPTDGTGYLYVDENIYPGHDTDGDWLPDGWEVQFNLNPRDDGMGGSWDDGPFGDPDGDGLFNIDEFFGQDGNRSTTRPYINGTGDETNPNEYNRRPDSTYKWRWAPVNPIVSLLTDPRPGTGISRSETLGAAWPTCSANTGIDTGADSDDDGIDDEIELYPANGSPISCPVASCDPFIPRAALIVHTNGILIPDPEPAATNGPAPAGAREDLQRRDWTIECQVKLLGTNMNGDLFDFRTLAGTRAVTVYRLSLETNAPVLRACNERGLIETVRANPLPTNRWVHLAGVWDHAANSMGLYVGGVLFNSAMDVGESFPGRFLFPATNRLALAVSPSGSFTNRLLLDEVRIWGVARTGDQIAGFANRLLPLGNGDDVWLDTDEGVGSPQYYGRTDTILVNGGALFEGEPGVVLSNVCQAVGTGNFWIDDGDRQYNAAWDVLLCRDSTLVEGLKGQLIANARWNDKDGTGDFSRDSLLAYYRFDDGGKTVEDFARRAKNGLVGATCEDFGFGDRGYALPITNVDGATSFLWVTNDFARWVANQPSVMDAAPVLGADQRGADDSDGDGMPDAWEMTHRLDPWDDGAHGESYPGAKDGPNGAKGDPDRDGLVNIYEYWAGTNPHDSDSDGNSVLDSQEDRDGDGVINLIEQRLGSRPDMVDTDDDGSSDNEEQAAGTSPIDPTDRPTDYYPRSLAVMLAGSRDDYLEIPVSTKQRLTDMTIEAYVMPTNVAEGFIIRRTIEKLTDQNYAVNFVMGLATNGAGLTLYGGYITPDGSPTGHPYIVRGAEIAIGRWTHVAMSYNALGAALTLYTNGVACAATNTFYEAPRVNGKGGETFVRIGEDLAGGIDELRVWNKARSAAEIRAAMTNILQSGASIGLIHSFRFDDGEAQTNRPASQPPMTRSWNEFHRPGGWQDFAVAADWSTQWAHAAAKHGRVGVTNGAIRTPPSLRVVITPEAAKVAGAQWQLDSGVWQNGGDSLQGLVPGSHTVVYKAVSGWTEPASVSVTLSNDLATTITGVYTQKASVSITLGPQEALDGNMRWKVDNGNWQPSGAVVPNLDAGHHTLSYTLLTGFVEPSLTDVNLNPGEALVIPLQYSRMYGAVSAVLQPAEAVARGAQWRINGRAWTNSGAVLSQLQLAPYTVEFSTVPGWVAPPAIAVTVTDTNTVVVTGQFTVVTGLETLIVPPEAQADGALWRLTGGGWTNSGAFLPLTAGVYTIQFTTIPGWLTPGDISASVISQTLTSVTAAYLKADILGGILGTNAGQFNQPRSVAVDTLHRVYVADTFNDRIQRYDPRDRSWMVWGGSGSADGKFDRPSAVAVDAQGNVYVADANNNRIQKLSATDESQFHALPGGGYGQGLGQFIAPADVAVDARTNLYVADLFNNRVQKMDASGAWTIAITNFSTTNLPIVMPKGLCVDAVDNLYVSDDGSQTNAKNRVQRFNAAGQFVALLGSRVPSEGGLSRPGGMTMGENNLYVADIDNSRVAWSGLTNTAWTTLLGSNVLNRPEDVVWDPRGFLYVADTLHHRVIRIPITANATNDAVHPTALASTPSSNSFTIFWYGGSNWYYTIQYADSLQATGTWQVLAGATNILGRSAITNYTDRTVGGATNRFYRIIAY